MGLMMIELALLSVALLAVAYPLFGRHAVELAGPVFTESDYTDLMYRKEAAYTALKDLEFDYKTSKINQDDYEAMKAVLESEALTALEALENCGQAPSDPAAAPSPQARPYCAQCGGKVAETHKFCPACGATL